MWTSGGVKTRCQAAGENFNKLNIKNRNSPLAVSYIVNYTIASVDDKRFDQRRKSLKFSLYSSENDQKFA